MERAVGDVGRGETPLAPIQLKEIVYLAAGRSSLQEVAIRLKREWLAGRRDDWHLPLEPLHEALLAAIDEPVPAEIADRAALARSEYGQ